MKIFFERYFNTSFDLKAALGPIRDLDERIDNALNNSSWKIEDEDIDQLREALIILQGDKRTLIKSIKSPLRNISKNQTVHKFFPKLRIRHEKILS